MNDDWRLRIDMHEEDHVRELSSALEEHPEGPSGSAVSR